MPANINVLVPSPPSPFLLPPLSPLPSPLSYPLLPLSYPLLCVQGTYIGMYGHAMWDVACVQTRGRAVPPDNNPAVPVADTSSSSSSSSSSSGYPPVPPTTTTGAMGPRVVRGRDLFADREERDYRASREQDERHRRRGGDGDLGGGRGGKVHHGAYWNTPALQASAASSNVMPQHQQQQSQTQSHVLGTGPGRGLFRDLRVTPRATRYPHHANAMQQCTTIHPSPHAMSIRHTHIPNSHSLSIQNNPID